MVVNSFLLSFLTICNHDYIFKTTIWTFFSAILFNRKYSRENLLNQLDNSQVLEFFSLKASWGLFISFLKSDSPLSRTQACQLLTTPVLGPYIQKDPTWGWGAWGSLGLQSWAENKCYNHCRGLAFRLEIM